MSSILIKNGSVYYQYKLQKLDLLIENDLITEIGNITKNADQIIDATGLSVLPGLIDIHVHLREPGYEYKETIKTGTQAAAAGGFTTICCMPNLNPVTDSVENIKYLITLIQKDAIVHVLPYASITKGEEGKELVNFKKLAPYCFAFSDDGVGVQNKRIMEGAIVTTRVLNKSIVSHCEDINFKDNEKEYRQLLRDIDLLKKIGGHYHVCHISTKQSVEFIRKAKQEGLNITCEATPHHLLLTKDEVMDDGSFKMNPPLSSNLDHQSLKEALIDGTIDIIASDHAPHSDEEKSQGFQQSLNGIVGLETSFSLIYTNFVKTNLISFTRFIDLMSFNATKIFHIDGGIIDIGKKANLSIFNLEETWVIDNTKFKSKGKSTPFNNKTCCGKNKYTLVDGKIVFQSI